MEVTQESKELRDHVCACYFPTQLARHIDLFGSDSGENIGLTRSCIYLVLGTMSLTIQIREKSSIHI